jgi:hypothetical protein
LDNHQVKEDEVSRACGPKGEKRNVYRILVGKPEGKTPLRWTILKWILERENGMV